MVPAWGPTPARIATAIATWMARLRCLRAGSYDAVIDRLDDPHLPLVRDHVERLIPLLVLRCRGNQGRRCAGRSLHHRWRWALGTPERDCAMTTRGYLPGRCSACGGRAEKSPTSARWWHHRTGRNSDVLVCPQTSLLLHQPVRWYGDGVLGPADATEQPARFVADAP
jgi:hypothetical protein